MIIKTCKKHGGLTKEQTTLSSRKKPVCRLCNRDYMRKFRTNKRTKNKVCDVHGELDKQQTIITKFTKNNILVEKRYCKTCYLKSLEDRKKKPRNKCQGHTPFYGENKRGKYCLICNADKSKNYRKNNPEYREKFGADYNRKRRQNLPDYYIKRLLKVSHLPADNIPAELIELKRVTLKIKKEIPERHDSEKICKRHGKLKPHQIYIRQNGWTSCKLCNKQYGKKSFRNSNGEWREEANKDN